MKNRIVWLATIILLGCLGLNPGFSQVAENLLENGGFESGETAPWTNYGGATVEVVDELTGASIPEAPIEGNYALHIVVDAPGANNWDVGLQHQNHVFEQGKHYTFSTWMKSKSGELDVRLKPELGADPWTAYGESVITITEEWAEYSTTLPVFTEDISPAALTYHIGFAAGDFWVDGVRFYEGDYVEPAFLNDISASNPIPASAGTDVGRDYTVLGWKPDPLASAHNVYFGETFADVNEADAANTATVISSLGQDANTLALDRLEFGKTYYWRVDEVNATPDKTVFKGSVWNFTVEPAYYLVPSASITATASSTGIPGAIAQNTVDGSGLNAQGQHSIDVSAMWLSSAADPEISIQYELDAVYKLHEMKIWNNNQGVEPLFGVGAKNITIETSLDGVEWSVLGDVELAQAPG
ncbi:MAG: carbohydrate binding domain-containing protein, partial [Phycisphaeraceae bacterium]|nr:carbohydrate binding domain-containing protein [Phycisphaeraceae bacterium]